MKKALFFFLILLSLSFAQNWLQPVSIAMFGAVVLLIILFMIGYGFGLDSLKFLAIEELYQVLMTVVIIAVLLGGESAINDTFQNLVGTYTAQTGNMHEIASKNLEDLDTSLGDIHTTIYVFTEDAALESTKSYMCQFLGTGFFFSGCSSYSTLLFPSTLAFQTLGLAFAELQSLTILLNFAQSYAFIFLLPAGAFLRSFKFTRGAGGLLIALAVTFYFILPLGIIFSNEVAEAYEQYEPVDTTLTTIYVEGPTPEEALKETFGFGLNYGDKCNPGEVITEGNPDKVKGLLDDFMDAYKGYMYYILIKTTLFTVLIIFLCFTVFRWLTSALGADIDITSLAKIA